MSHSLSSESPRSLLSRARNRDLEAFGRLRDLYAPLVFSWCQRVDLPDVDILRVAQSVFLSVQRNIDALGSQTQGQSFRAWLRSTTESQLTEVLSLRGRPPLTWSDRSPTVLDETVATSDSSHLTRPMAELEETSILYMRAIDIIAREYPDWYGQALTGLIREGRPITHVADEVGQSVSAIQIARSRILHRLRTEFAEVL